MTMSELSSELEKFFSEETDEKSIRDDLIIKTANDLTNGALDLLKLIESIGPAINHKSSLKRIQAMSFLSDTLSKVSKSLLTAIEINDVCSFLMARLSSDHHVCSVILEVVLLMIDYENISDENVCHLLNAIFQEVNCQSLIMSERRTIYLIFNKCLQTKLKAVSKMSSQFILGFVGALDGETDPRNLLLAFSFYPFIAQNLPLGSYAEDFFEVVAAYFPINFTPPSNVAEPISNEELVTVLRNCMSANESLFPFCIPFIIEKISSNMDSFDIEAIRILKVCCSKYSASGISPHLWSLIFMLYNLVTTNINSDVTTESMECLKLISSLYVGENVSNECVKNAGETVSSLIAECLPNMTNPGHLSAKSCCQILTSVGSGAAIFSELICLKTFPALMDAYKSAKEYSHRNNVLTMITDVIKCAKTSNILLEDKCRQVQKDFFDIFSGITTTIDDVMLGPALDLFADNVSSFTEEQACCIMLQALQHPQLCNNRSSIECCLSSSCDEYPKMVAERVTDAILQAIKANETSMENAYLLLLPSTCRHKLVVDKLLPKIWSWFDQSFHNNDINSLPLLEVALKCLKMADDSKLLTNEMADNEWKDVHRLVMTALQLIILRPKDLQRHLQILAHISHYFVRITDRTVVENLLLYLIGKLEASESHNFDLSNEAISDLTCDIEITEGYIIFPIFGLICNSYRLKGMEISDMEFLTRSLRNLCCYSTLGQCRDLAAKTLSLLFNLLQPDYPMKVLQQETIVCVATNLKTGSLEMQEAVLKMNFWVAKGLIMRDFTDAVAFASLLEDHLLSTDYGAMASDLFQILLQDCDDLFNKSTGANIRRLYKQRYFEGRIDSLLRQFHQSEGNARYNTQMAILYLLPCIPNAVRISCLSKVLPVLLQCLTVDSPKVVNVGVSCLISVIPKSPEVFADHLASVVSPLIKHSQSIDINCRIKSIECIRLLSTLTSINVIPYKHEVMMGLRKSLNDRKRIARRGAAAATLSWDAVGA